MAKNYFIGIGGTGARLAEALVHLCAAGLGPKDLTLFLIDPDQGNGNLARTTSLMEAYVSARASLTHLTSVHDFDPFKTAVTLPDPAVWHIFDRRGVRLADHVGLPTIRQNNPALADFATVLFSDDEMQTALDEGFRGHPNIGATVISDVPTDTDPWRTFWRDVESAQGPGEVQVFVSGSIFGGTGAAGIPTLGAPDVLKFAQRASLGTSSKIRLAAGLILPYFSFTPGAVPAGQSQMFVTAADFPLATKAALAYYAEKELAYDDVYLLGDSLAQNVGAFSPGNQNQKNRPHYIELSGALAALDFYRSTPHNGPTQYFHAARENPLLGWDDLPVSRDAAAVPKEKARLKQKLTAFATFAYAALGHGAPTLERDVDAVVDAWHVDHFSPRNLIGRRNKDKDPRQPADRQRLDALIGYLDRFAAWASALDPGPDSNVRLFNGPQLMADGRVPDPETPAGDIAIGTLLRDRTQNMRFTAFKDALNALKVVDQPDASVSNSDVFVNLFYQASRDFAAENYELQTVEDA